MSRSITPGVVLAALLVTAGCAWIEPPVTPDPRPTTCEALDVELRRAGAFPAEP